MTKESENQNINIEMIELRKQVEAGKMPAFRLSEKRYRICLTCPKLIKLTGQCGECWCFVKLKTKIVSAECPRNKW